MAHAVTEAAFKQLERPSDDAQLRTWAEGLWDRSVVAAERKLAAAWAPAQPPGPDDWPGYFLTRARTIRRVVRLLEGQHEKTGAPPAPGTGVEIELTDPTSMLIGRADRIEVHHGETRVIDLKSGLHQGEPTEQQHRQLLLYAALVHRTSGSWPKEVAIEDASGDQVRLPLDPVAAEAALAESLASTAKFNEKIAANAGFDSHPTADRCRWCPFRIACRPYWQAIDGSWEHRSLMGAVEAKGTSAAGAFVQIRVQSPTDRAGELVHVSGIPATALPDGASIATIDLATMPSTGDARARWSTLVRVW